MKSQGPFCQSCAMPMDKPEIFGTDVNGTKSIDYCTYCYQNGKFTAPNITVQEMIGKCVEIMVQRNILPERQAKDLMMNTIPNLKRWKK
jgi:hypothetical protein